MPWIPGRYLGFDLSWLMISSRFRPCKQEHEVGIHFMEKCRIYNYIIILCNKCTCVALRSLEMHAGL